MYKKKCLSKEFKLRHYNAVVRPAVLYGSETLILAGCKLSLEDLEKKERRILRKILGPTPNQNGAYVLKSNKELYEFCSKITDDIRNR